MIKPLYALLFGLLMFGLGILVHNCGGYQEPLEDPQIHRLEENLRWTEIQRAIGEKKLKDKISKDSTEKIALAKDVIKERQRADQSDARLREHRKQPILATTKDTISFLIEDDTLCDQALTDSKKLAAGLTIEVMTDEAIIKGLESLSDSLQADKKDLVKLDSLNQIDKKQLRKASRKKFFRGLGIGGTIGLILGLLL